MIVSSLPDASRLPAHDVCVVGAGPVGIALALACSGRGLRVLLVESGGVGPGPAAALSAGHTVDPGRHAAPAVAICRALGGASHWWGGRCVPFDPVDFEPRPFVPEASWPIGYGDLLPWFAPAAAFFGLPSAIFSAGDAQTSDGIERDGLERWAPETDCGALHRPRLAADDRVTALTGVSVTGLRLSADGRRLAGLDLAGPEGSRLSLSPARTVLACGGLETTRLLLALRAAHPGTLGGREGPLGRFYMGHLSGRIADIQFDTPAEAARLDFFEDGGAFARRRLTLMPALQRREKVLNTAFWLDNPPFHAASHGSGALSLVWMALACPPLGRRLVSEALRLSHVGPPPHRLAAHLGNTLRTPLGTGRDLGRILTERYLRRPRRPGFLLGGADGRHALHYHAEQAPRAESRVTLSERLDPLGLPFLDVDLRYGEEDARSVVRSHALLDAALRRGGRARLVYHTEPDARAWGVLDQARDGFHQIGTARMGTDPARSVVDSDCRVHGLGNLFVASSAVFPSSGQANPTFTAVALALRLADHLGRASAAADRGWAPLGEPIPA